MQTFTTRLHDKSFFTGIVLLVISLAFFSLPFFIHFTEEAGFALFLPNFTLTAVYFILLLIRGTLRKGREGLYSFFLFLILFFISAWSLNRSITVFNESVTWFSVLLVILCINYIAFAFWASIPNWIRHIMSVLSGIAMIVFIYLSCYLAPLYVIGVAAFFFFGFSLHVFIASLFCIYTLVLFKKIRREGKDYGRDFLGGMILAVTLITIFVINWHNTVVKIDNTYRHATAAESDGLPEWVAIAQKVSTGSMTEKVLKTELVYSVANYKSLDRMFWSLPDKNFGETRKHDPLIMIASFFAGIPNISEENKIKVLESMYDARHQAEERLWSDEHLQTEHINTAVQIWPQFELSYTEKKITVSNFEDRKAWNNNEEALYTFHLPEGAVITSLSLWIEGKEEKGLLTTRSKAANAYRTIVGRERRDPSVVHWQEGNRVTVRVFPVVAGESRIFKIGITAPLARQDGKLVYENMYFDGPSARSATENVTIDFQQEPKNFMAPAVFSVTGKRSYKRTGKYDPSWKIQITEEPLSTAAFSFDGKLYNTRPYQKQRSSTTINTVYLDVNRYWTANEFDTVYELIKNKQVYVYPGKLVRLTPENKDELYSSLEEQQFSLFPMFAIEDSSASLLISKSPALSPNLGDLKDSRFMQQLKKGAARHSKIKLFNIGNQLSPYLKSLKEYRTFQYEHGTVAELKALLDSHVFANDIENDRQVVIDNAEMAIVQSEGAIPSAAPDHLMRLFAYNHIMQQMGVRKLTEEDVTDDIITEAEKSYVVSPVSSLIVLEKQEDYDRFDIKASQNSLQNASLKSNGSVPEPHEWALIILGVLVIAWLKFHPRLKKAA